MQSAKCAAVTGVNFGSKTTDIKSKRKSDQRTSDRRAFCLLAAVTGVTGLFTGSSFAQVTVPTPLLDITANDYSQTSGIITPNVAPSGLIITGSTPTLVSNQTSNGTQAIGFNGSSYFQFNTSAGARDVLTSGTNITILAYVEASATSSNAYSIVGGAGGSLQYRLETDSSVLQQAVLRGGVQAFGHSSTTVPLGSFNAVGVAMPTGTTGTATYFLNGSSSGTSNISTALVGGFDEFGARDTGSEAFNGKIVELTVYNSVLTPAQIAQAQSQMATNYTSTSQLYYTGGNSFGNGGTNFVNISGGAVTYADNANSVVFGDTLPNSQVPITGTNISIVSGGVFPTAVTINNNVNSYFFADAEGLTGVGIAGGTGITKNYNGNLTFNSSNSLTGPVVLNGGNTYLNANAAIDTASSVNVGTGAYLFIQPAITLGGATSVNLSGGALSLGTGSTFTSTGGVAVNGGTLILNSGYTPLGSSLPLTLNSAGNNIPSILFNQSSPTSNTTFAPATIAMPTTSSFYVSQGNVTVLGNISGAGGLLVNHAGLVTLAGSNTYTGTTLINHGALQLTGNYAPTGNTSNISFSNGGNTNTLIVSGGTSTFPSLTRVDMGSGANTISNILVNSGTLNIAASVTVADDNYAEVTVKGGNANLTGVLTLSYPNGQASSINVLGGTLATTSSLEGITVGNIGHSASINLDGGTLLASTINGNNNPVGVLNFNGGTLQANGSTAALVSALGNAFIYAGGATINDGGNTVTVPQSLSNPIGSGLTSIAVTNNGTGYSYVPTVRITGGTVLTGGAGASAIAIFNAATGQVTGVQITNPGNYSSTAGLAFQFSSQAGVATIVAPTVAYTSATNTSGAFNKAGSGTLVLSGNSTYTGPTNILAGTLRVTSPGPSVPIVNGSFDTPVTTTLGMYGYQFGSGVGQPITLNQANSGWTYSGNYAGITNGAGYLEDGTTPVGTGQYAFLQQNGSIAQTTTFPANANYILSYFIDSRIQGGQPDAQTMAVELNGTNISNGAVQGGVTWSQQTIIFAANAGSNTLAFQGLNPSGGDQTILLNGVSINEVGGNAVSTAIPSVSQVNVTSGANLDVFNSTITIGSVTGPGNVNLGSGALTVGGDNSTNSNFSGVISGTGSLTKIGTGTQLLTGPNTYTGSTIVSHGVLSVGIGTVLTSPTIAVANGGVFGVTQPNPGGISSYAGTISVAPGGGLSMVDGNIGTLNLTRTTSPVLTLGTAGSSVPANLGFEISSTGADITNVSGTVLALSPVSISVIGIGNSLLSAGNYTLLTATGGLGTSSYSLGVNAIAVDGEGYGLSLASSTSTKEVLTVTDIGAALATAYWSGAKDGNWGTNVSGGTNWTTDVTGAVDTHIIPSAFTNVYFTVASGGANLATSLSSNQSINSITFNGDASAPVSISGYTLSIGASTIGGNAMGNGLNMASGSTAVTINSNVSLVNSQTWTNNSPNPLTINGSIGGIASLTQAGPGLIVLAGNNTFNGGYNLAGGTLAINSNSALGSGPFAINTATTLDNTSGTTVNLTANNTQSWNSDFTFTGSNNLNMGNGTVAISANRTVTLTAGSLTVGGITDSGLVYSLTTAGSGNLSLSGASSYKGFTAVHNSSSLSFVGAASYTGGGTLFLTPGSSTQTVAVNFNSTGLESFGNIQLGNSPGTAVFNLSSGTVNVSTGIYSASAGGSAIINVTGGTLNTGVAGAPGSGQGQAGNFEFGAQGGGAVAVLNQSGGTINVTGGEGLDVLLGTFDTSGATFNLTGGTFNTNGGIVVGYRFPSFINVSGTAVLSSPQIVLGAVGTSNGFNGTGTLNISTGGIVSTSTLRQSGNGGFVNFNGGTLQATSSTATLFSGFSTGTVNALTGGAIFDTNGFNVTVTSPIISPAGVTGGITKVGLGTLILTGSNGYSGSTQIKAGTLQLPQVNNGAIANYNFLNTVAGGATYAPTGASWNFSADNGAAPFGSGITNGTAFTFNGTPPNSTQVGFVQEDGSFNQSINIPTAGTYTLSFYTEQRATGNGKGQALDVTLDNPFQGGIDFSGATQGGPGLVPGTTWALTSYIFSGESGSHLLNFAGLDPNGDDSTAYVDDVVLTGPGLTTVSSVLPSTTPVVISDNATFDLNSDTTQIGSLAGTALASVTMEYGSLTIGNDNTSPNYAGTIVGYGSLTKVGTGVQTLSGANNYSGGTNVAGGTLVFAAPGAFPTFTSLNVGSGAVAMAGLHGVGVAPSARNNLFVSSLSIAGTTGAWTGTVDLSNNDMDVQNGNLAMITNQVAQGYNQGQWNGTGGILSSAAATSTRHLTALGVISNSTDQVGGTNGGTQLYATFDGQTAAITDVLVKYTYYGDSDLSGTVDGTDYSRIDNGFINQLTGWYNGDFNYDGVIDGSDYALIDNSFNTQGSNIASEIAASPTAQIGSSGTAAVPEPTSLALLGIGAAGLLGRRRRRSH